MKVYSQHRQLSFKYKKEHLIFKKQTQQEVVQLLYLTSCLYFGPSYTFLGNPLHFFKRLEPL